MNAVCSKGLSEQIISKTTSVEKADLFQQVQQEAFDRESKLLWDFASTVKELSFRGIEDVLEENEILQQENFYLKNLIESNLTEILQILDGHASQLANLQAQQGSTSDSVDQLEQLAAVHGEKIALNTLMNEEQDAVIQDNTVKITMLDSSLTSVNETLANLETLPLGTIISWNELDVDSHPPNWVECDGRTIQAGPWEGKTTPDINNSKRFLRGGTLAEAFQEEEDAFQEHHHQHTHNYRESSRAMSGSEKGDGDGTPRFVKFGSFSGSTDGAIHGKIVAGDLSTSARTAAETRPKNIKVVFLMKCWHNNQFSDTIISN